MFKRLSFLLVGFMLVSSNQALAASTPAEKWSPYLGESNIYVKPDGARWTHQMMYWRTGSKVEFDAVNDTYEHQTVFYNYDNAAFAKEPTGVWQTDLPDPYLDTQILNDSGVAGTSGEADISIGTFDPDVIAASTWYYGMAELKNTSSTKSKYKISGQEGLSYCPDKNCVDGETSAIYIPFKDPFTAPENNRDFKYEWESNNTMDAAADDIEVNDWGAGTISSTSDVDYWDFQVYVDQYIDFFMKVPSNVDYDVKIYNSSGTQVASGTAETGVTESFRAWLPVGKYYIKVYSWSGSDVYAQYQVMPYNSVTP